MFARKASRSPQRHTTKKWSSTTRPGTGSSERFNNIRTVKEKLKKHSFSPLSAADSKPNVLFLAVDDMNDWIGCLEEITGGLFLEWGEIPNEKEEEMADTIGRRRRIQ